VQLKKKIVRRLSAHEKAGEQCVDIRDNDAEKADMPIICHEGTDQCRMWREQEFSAQKMRNLICFSSEDLERS
jgi:hypothetical protein